MYPYFCFQASSNSSLAQVGRSFLANELHLSSDCESCVPWHGGQSRHGRKQQSRKQRRGRSPTPKHMKKDTLSVVLQWSCHHDGSPETPVMVGVDSSAKAANDAVLDEFCEYVWHDHPKGQKLHDVAAKKKGLLDLEYGTDGNFGEGEVIGCRAEKHTLRSSSEP